jgi:DNA-directed RNA polymerase specialized sigma24 family protein
METSLSLLEQVRERPDDPAWERLVALYQPLLEAWLRRFGLQRFDADDVMQETRSSATKKLKFANP